MTISVAVCLFVRAVVLIMLAGDEITIANFVSNHLVTFFDSSIYYEYVSYLV